MKHIHSDRHINGHENWYKTAFGSLYPIIYAHRTVEAAAEEVRFACEAVSLTSTDHALDLCCGTGRHLVTLQETGATLSGLDYSHELLHLARKQLSPGIRLIRGDMRRLPFQATFDVVFSFFTSFGYFQEDTENLEAAREIGRVLTDGGRFFMDYLNPLNVKITLKKETTRVVEGYTLLERRWIDQDSRRVNKQTEVKQGDELIETLRESVRLYSFEEMSSLLQEAGLRIESCQGNYDNAPYDNDSPRMLLAGVKARL